MQKFFLKDLCVNCILGDTPEERTAERPVFVSVELEFNMDNVAKSDKLCDTVDYAVLAERIAVALKQSKCRMLERAVAIVLETCLNDKRIVAAEVEIEKRGSLPGLGAAKVRMSNK